MLVLNEIYGTAMAVNIAISSTSTLADITNKVWSLPRGFGFCQFTLPRTPMTCFPFSNNRYWKNGPTARTMLQMIDQHLDDISVQLMQQTHGNTVATVRHRAWHIRADAMHTQCPNLGLATYTADCVPVMLTDHSQRRVAIVHAGWRGLYQNIITQACAAMLDHTDHDAVSAWIGPSICQPCYQVSQSFVQSFVAAHPYAIDFFTFHESHAYFDCVGFAQQQLKDCGIKSIHTDPRCTYENPSIPSHRRQGHTSSARLLSVIWLKPSHRSL